MKQKIFKFVCTVLLICSVLLALPACAADFDEALQKLKSCIVEYIKLVLEFYCLFCHTENLKFW